MFYSIQKKIFGGGKENRTPDPLLAKQVLSQLSYTPIFCHLFRICPPSLRLMYPMYTATPFAEQLRKI